MTPPNEAPGCDDSPLFITGVPRCGSSWVGSVLARSAPVRYLYEPFNPQWSPKLAGRLAHFRYLPPRGRPGAALARATSDALQGRQTARQLARAAYRGYLRAALHRAERVLIKDPTAVLLSGWLAAAHSTRVLVITRHPCGFASSLAALGWRFSVERLLRQERLMRDHLADHEATLRASATDPWLEHGAFWAAVHHVLLRQAVRQPGAWTLRSYESLCTDPPGGFRDLADTLGLAADPRVLDKALGHRRPSTDPGSTRKDSRAAAGSWKTRLSPGQADAVLGAVREFRLEGLPLDL